MVSLIRVSQVVKGMNNNPTDGTWGMVTNFIWMYVDTRPACLPPANKHRLVEMWLGIICTCLPILYTFFRTRLLAKRGSGSNVAFPAIRDPNSGRVHHNANEQPEDSGYHSGQRSNFSFEQFDTNGDAQKADVGHSVRRAASDKSLLVSSSRCSD